MYQDSARWLPLTPASEVREIEVSGSFLERSENCLFVCAFDDVHAGGLLCESLPEDLLRI